MKFQQTNLKKVKSKHKKEEKRNKGKGPLFKIVRDGLDVKVLRDIGGHWGGMCFSDLKDDFEGRKLLGWITRADFDEDIIEIAQGMLDEL